MRAGIKPATDCMMMLTFSLVGVSVNTFAAERFTSCRHIMLGNSPNKKHLHGYSIGANYCAKPYKKREVWESNPRLPHYQPEVSFKLILLQPRYRRVWTPALPPYCRSCDLTLP